ncbi:hypothetical protein GXN76_04705 [Kroppenstedtia pulmonis]|uniref:Uncharacterized protein n=1 Tax=Kroppenstedtia pulmonis TaxID=1380685 RepID=A0A7D3Y405_9BACL|nr:hypothetical protein [Kroppenstedtia pulmonis]QKG83845.1 hypothetical protein GXN76_04705 [Kroppenstedtia pulmonis]
MGTYRVSLTIITTILFCIAAVMMSPASAFAWEKNYSLPAKGHIGVGSFKTSKPKMKIVVTTSSCTWGWTTWQLQKK